MSELDDCKYTIRRSMLLLLLPSPRRSHDQPSHHSAVSTSTIIAEQTNCSTVPWQCQVTPRFYLYLPRISYRCQRVPRYVVTVERTRGPRETHSSRADGETHQAARAFSVPSPLARRGGTIARLFFMGFAVLRAPPLLTPTYIGRRLYGRCTFPRQDFSP